jgi:DNA-binding HxlR family transcriptional regulator
MGPGACVRFHSAIEMIGARWSGAVLNALFEGNRRYCDLRAGIPGISDTMLTQRLRDLEVRGVVRRSVSPGPPTRVEYRLTEMGIELHPILVSISAWSRRWLPIAEGDRDGLPTAASVPGPVHAKEDAVRA